VKHLTNAECFYIHALCVLISTCSSTIICGLLIHRLSQNLASMVVKIIHFRIVWYINQTNILNIFILEIKYHICHTGLTTYHEHNFSIFMAMPQKEHEVALKVFQVVFSTHCVYKTMHHHTVHMHVWVERCHL